MSAIGAEPEQHHCVILYFKSGPVGDSLLTGFDGFIVKLFHLAAADTDDVIMMIGAGQLKHRPVTFELEAPDQARPFALGKNPVDGRNTYILTLFKKQLINLIGAEVLFRVVFQHLEDLDPWQRDFQAHLFQSSRELCHSFAPCLKVNRPPQQYITRRAGQREKSAMIQGRLGLGCGGQVGQSRLWLSVYRGDG